MKQIYSIGLLVALILQSCGTNDVVSKRIIQKRKYNKGFHIAKRGNLNSKQEKVQSDEKVYSYDHHAKAQLNKTQKHQEQRNLLEEKAPKINHLKTDMVKSKTKERSEDNINRIASSNIKNEENDHREEQKYRVENENTLDISKFSLRAERTDEEEAVAPDLVQRRSKRIRGLSIATIVLSSAGLILFALALFTPLIGLFEYLFFIALGIMGAAGLLALFDLILYCIQPIDERSRQDKIWVGVAWLSPVIATSVILLTIYLIFLHF